MLHINLFTRMASVLSSHFQQEGERVFSNIKLLFSWLNWLSWFPWFRDLPANPGKTHSQREGWHLLSSLLPECEQLQRGPGGASSDEEGIWECGCGPTGPCGSQTQLSASHNRVTFSLPERQKWQKCGGKLSLFDWTWWTTRWRPSTWFINTLLHFYCCMIILWEIFVHFSRFPATIAFSNVNTTLIIVFSCMHAFWGCSSNVHQVSHAGHWRHTRVPAGRYITQLFVAQTQMIPQICRLYRVRVKYQCSLTISCCDVITPTVRRQAVCNYIVHLSLNCHILWCSDLELFNNTVMRRSSGKSTFALLRFSIQCC